MSISPPSQRIWWKQPIDKIEFMWIVLALTWCLILFLWMPYWHIYGKQNLSNESYRTSTEMFEKKVNAMVEKLKSEGKVRDDASGTPIAAPAEGSDVYMLGRTFEWYPILELEKGKTYRLHLSSLDVQHGFSLQPTNMNLQILPGYETVIKITPTDTGEFGIICNEYCGLGHHNMTGRIIVK